MKYFYAEMPDVGTTAFELNNIRSVDAGRHRWIVKLKTGDVLIITPKEGERLIKEMKQYEKEKILET